MSRRILVFGDSHVHAIREALKARGAGGTAIPIEVRRLLKAKKTSNAVDPLSPRRSKLAEGVRKFFRSRASRDDEMTIGDTSLEQVIEIARRLSPEDVLVSVIGGNQHAVFSTIQHPQPFDFFLPDGSLPAVPADAELIPFRALYGFFLSALRRGDGMTIAALRNSTRARVLHLIAPPPKKKNHFIEHYHDTHFANEGIASQGVSSPELRMKFWRLQNRAIEEICAELGIQPVEPPQAACDPEGFLARDYYAGDATHANACYGELVIQQLEHLSTGKNAGPMTETVCQ